MRMQELLVERLWLTPTVVSHIMVEVPSLEKTQARLTAQLHTWRRLLRTLFEGYKTFIEVQLAYAIWGYDYPVSVNVETFGTSRYTAKQLEGMIRGGMI